MNAAGIGGRNILKKRSTARRLHTNVNVVIASVFSTLMATRIGSIVAMIAISKEDIIVEMARDLVSVYVSSGEGDNNEC